VDGFGIKLQFERFYRLNHVLVHTYITQDSDQLSQIWGKVCGGNGVSVRPHAHPPHQKVLKHHILYVLVGCVMQFERFYSLNRILLALFVPLHHPVFRPALPNLGKGLWW
jgi:hypothetical protein